MKVQIHAAHTAWPGELRRDYHAMMSPFTLLKPAGFWTSTETEPWSSAWLQACRETVVAREKIAWLPAALVRFQALGSPKVLEISGEDDMIEALERLDLIEHMREPAEDGEEETRPRYPSLERLFSGGLLWDDLERRFDAIRWSPGWPNRDDDEIASVFECESTVWFRPWESLRVLEVATPELASVIGVGAT